MKAAFLTVVSGLLVFAASAQPPATAPKDAAQPKEGARDPGQPEPNDRAGLKARAERRLAEAKRQQERWEAAIKKLDAGAPVEEVEAEMRSPRPFQGGRGGGTGGDRGDGGRGPRGGTGPDGGPDRGPPPMPGSPTGDKLSREQVQEFLAKNYPLIAARFTAAMTDNPGLTSRILDRMEPMVRELLAERDPEMHTLRRANFENGFELLDATKAFVGATRRNAPAEELKTVGDKLRLVLGEHFDLQIKMHQQEIVMLERRIGQLRGDLERQLPKREEFIRKRMDGLQRMPSKDREHSGGGGPPQR